MGKKWDWFLFLLIIALGSLSILIIYSINKSLFENQLIFWFIGILLLIFFSYFDFRIWQKLSLPFYVVSLLSLLIVFLTGEPVRGSVRWIDLGAFRFQPSEITKVAIIPLLSAFYLNRTAYDLKNLFISFLIISPAVILIFIQPDIGNTIAFLAIWLGISVASKIHLKQIIAVFLIAPLLLIIFIKFLAPYQQERLSTFVNPTRDPLGTGYHIIQSKIAIGSGQFLGKGLGQGSQSQLKFLPEAESDFVFASLAEQLGFTGAGLLIILFGTLLVKIIKVSKNKERFGQLIIAGTVAFLTAQFLINVAMNMGLLPVTGITLPLISYGGSSLISTLILLGIVFSVERFSVDIYNQ